MTMRYRDVLVTEYPDCTITRFNDGTDVLALHAEQPGQRETAARLGYASAEAMNAEHDHIHTRLAFALGLPHSPTLWDVAHGHEATELHHLEEDMVLAAQKFLTAARGLMQ